MRCPFCGNADDRVVDSREARNGLTVRRRRECGACGRRFTSYERIEEIPFMVVKKDGTRTEFDRAKLRSGLLKACEKRPVRSSAVDAIVDRVEQALHDREDREIPTSDIGAIVMDGLRDLDKIAFVRFASVYRRFEDVGAFVDEVRNLSALKDG